MHSLKHTVLATRLHFINALNKYRSKYMKIFILTYRPIEILFKQSKNYDHTFFVHAFYVHKELRTSLIYLYLHVTNVICQ